MLLASITPYARREHPNIVRNGLLTLVVGAVVTVIFIPKESGAATQASQGVELDTSPKETVSVIITSDPMGAEVFVGGYSKGYTPMTLAFPKNETSFYRVVAEEPYEDYDLYEPYNG